MPTYPTQHETFVAMIAEVQRTRAALDLREQPVPAEDADRARDLVTSNAA